MRKHDKEAFASSSNTPQTYVTCSKSEKLLWNTIELPKATVCVPSKSMECFPKQNFLPDYICDFPFLLSTPVPGTGTRWGKSRPVVYFGHFPAAYHEIYRGTDLECIPLLRKCHAPTLMVLWNILRFPVAEFYFQPAANVPVNLSSKGHKKNRNKSVPA